MEKKEIKTHSAPAAVGPYSQAVRSGAMLFLSGQIPIDPVSGEPIKGDAAAQTRQALKNAHAVLEAAGAGFKDVVKATVYLKDITHFAAMNKVYAEFFMPPYPARSTIEVSNLPKGVDVEIDLIAMVNP